ncbi:MAG: hypothetical protein HC857_12040 [Synechococcales cyanobacterium RU_4_20]|nr:hypothetical protein [Synechococcales cyanobacterium RU_4_20]
MEAMSAVLGDSGEGGCASDIVKLITLAPELDPSGAVIAFLVERGITVSLGHSQPLRQRPTAPLTRGQHW